MNPKLFVPYNVRNQIINENSTKEKDLQEFAEVDHNSILKSYMSEKKIHKAFSKRQYDGLVGRTKNFGLNYDNFIKGIGNTIKDLKYTIDHPYGSLNCGFIMNPSRFISPEFTGDTGLKAYWKFNETSGDIINVSASGVDLGSNADLQMAGSPTYNVSSGVTNMDYSMTFDGVDDKGLAGTSTSQWNFMHDTSALWTVAFWSKVTGTSGNEAWLGTGDSWETAQNIGMNFGLTLSNLTARFTIGNGTSPVCLINAPPSWVPDKTSWHLYTLTYDQSSASNNAKMRNDVANLQQGTKTAQTPSGSDSTDVMNVGKDQQGGHWLTGGIEEMSIWNKVMSLSDQNALYNSGDGLEIY